ncbi:oxidoreductase-like domain-containing protein [Rheinheimera sp. MM224]|uniref:oxidoreductase-like domain-containing protein n=1 Tax=Rheinheimera sp. MM224 TaxID=3019969 RepID=UPI0021F81B9F|nr:oxidoreductase-like domain-containing protein [Rheinheimera sp. MM224]CAI3802212.1 hypothetical protein JAMGFMIE_03043 [Rheinheimera sp. MM224]
MFTTIDGIRLRIPTEEPVAPESSDCCGSGSCCPCVWDYYRAQQKAWLAQGSDADTKTEASSG